MILDVLPEGMGADIGIFSIVGLMIYRAIVNELGGSITSWKKNKDSRQLMFDSKCPNDSMIKEMRDEQKKITELIVDLREDGIRNKNLHESLDSSLKLMNENNVLIKNTLDQNNRIFTQLMASINNLQIKSSSHGEESWIRGNKAS